MTDAYDVDDAALRRFGESAEAAAERIERIRKRTSKLTLNQGTFGKMPQADSLKNDYDEQHRESTSDLKNAEETLNAIADALRGSADNYDSNEQEQTKRFGGGA